MYIKNSNGTKTPLNSVEGFKVNQKDKNAKNHTILYTVLAVLAIIAILLVIKMLMK